MENKIEELANDYAFGLNNNIDNSKRYTTNIKNAFINGLKSELAKEYWLSQQEPIKNIEELKSKFKKEIVLAQTMEAYSASYEEVWDFFLPYLRKSNIQSDAVEFADYLDIKYLVFNGKNDAQKEYELFTEFKKSKGIKQNTSYSRHQENDIDYDITKEE